MSVRHIDHKMQSVHALVTDLSAQLPDISAIYCVVKYKNGAFAEMVCGESGDLAFAIMVLQKYLMENIEGV